MKNPIHTSLPSVASAPEKSSQLSVSWHTVLQRASRAALAITCALALALTGCGKDKGEKEKSEKSRRDRPTAERIQEVQLRIAHLHDSLAQLYQETEIQQAKIRNAQENLEALRKALGELARSRDLRSVAETSLPVAMAPVEKPSKAETTKETSRREKTKEKENRALSVTLLVFFIVFLVVFGYSAVAKRKRTAAEETPAEQKEAQSENYITVNPPQKESSPSGEESSQGSDSRASGDDKQEPTPPGASS
ncbi:MAG: hypothetical protein D6691_04475 [Candidatus Hydrogenedentota bacterium]|uniref:Uncharacterized protein n=1 Tax=Sumerlaea chitinivorans TaxID=2250252 RepID=A0A2Z4Y6H0_SUMC1|nr:hypothetical protein BRCON_2017 [Candidatus Sumerlaea chitinivorans]MCX7963832.1 hypothetical protein [Candidatus Sumerlaea chitinivorans]RMH28599.1 MAG: hypothetical protein D6691_04475 [Candidatus Hydrogenedentota bacterium]